MKKRLLCTLLIAAMCLSETVPAGAVSVSGNAVQETEEAAEAAIKEGAAAGETAAYAETDAAGDIDAEQATATIYPTGDIPVDYPYGKDYEFKFQVTPNTKYTVAIYNASGEEMESKMNTSPEGTSSSNTVAVSVKFGLSALDNGDYTLKYWIGNKEALSTAQVSEAKLRIRKSIDTNDNTSITAFTVADVAYTGSTVIPDITIKEKTGDTEYTLVSGTDYTYELTSENKKKLGTVSITITGCGNYMGTVTKTFDIVPPSPAIESVTPSCSSVTLKWTKVADANGYYIERKSENGTFQNVGTVTGNATNTYVDTSEELTVGQTYYYRVQAYATSTTNTEETVSSVANETGVMVKVVPSTPKLVSAVNTSYNKIKLTWDAVEGASGYVVYSVDSTGKLKKVKKTTKTAYTVASGITCGKTYRYTVKAYAYPTGSTTPVYSDYDKTGLKIKAKPATPVLVSAKVEDGSKVLIKWKKVTKAYGYVIYRKEKDAEDSTWKKVKTVKYGDTTSAYDTKAEVGVKYIYSVKAYTKVDGKKIYSDLDTKGLTVNVIPGKATFELAQIGKCVEVRINKMSGMDGYLVYRKEGDGSYKKLGSVQANANGSVTTYYDRSISYAKNYTYYVKAYKNTDATRVAGTASAKKSITTK